MHNKGELMGKTIPIKAPINHKKKTTIIAKKPWEETKEHHTSELEQQGKLRQHKHFPSHRWPIHLEKRKGHKI